MMYIGHVFLCDSLGGKHFSRTNGDWLYIVESHASLYQC